VISGFVTELMIKIHIFLGVSPCRLASIWRRFESTTLLRKSVIIFTIRLLEGMYEGWNFNSGNYLFTTDTK